jgi:hypothetical protein
MSNDNSILNKLQTMNRADLRRTVDLLGPFLHLSAPFGAEYLPVFINDFIEQQADEESPCNGLGDAISFINEDVK